MSAVWVHLVTHELRAQARRRLAGRRRLLMALGLAALAAWSIAAPQSSCPLSDRGRLCFIVLALACAVHSLVAGLRRLGSCQPEAWREGSVELMLRTGVKGPGVVLGQFMPAFARGCLEVFPAVPLLVFAATLGGTSTGEACRMSLVVAATLGLSLAVGFASSATCRDDRAALTTTALLLLSFVVWCPVVGLLCNGAPLVSGLGMWFLAASPSYAFRTALASAVGGSSAGFARSIVTIAVVTAGLLGLAGRQLGRACRQAVEPEPRALDSSRRPMPEGPNLSRCAGSAAIDFASSGDASRNGLDRSVFFRRAATALPLIIAAGLFLATRAQRGSAVLVLLGALCAVHVTLKVLLAVAANSVLSKARHARTLAPLLATPVSAADWLGAAHRAVRRRHRLPLAATLLANWVALGSIALSGGSMFALSEKVMIGVVLVAGCVQLWIDAFALCWLGMWHGLGGRGLGVALLETLGGVLVPPWAVMVALLAFNVGSFYSVNEFAAYFLVWLGFGGLLSPVAGAWARHELIHQLRSRAVA